MSGYTSEFTQFFQAWLAEHPEARASARQGRSLWWDKPQNLAWLAEQAAARVPTLPYYYDTAHPHLEPHREGGYRPALPPNLAKKLRAPTA